MLARPKKFYFVEFVHKPFFKLLVYKYKNITYNMIRKLNKGRGDEVDEMDSFLPNKIQT
jgi:hypothetical protein